MGTLTSSLEAGASNAEGLRLRARRAFDAESFAEAAALFEQAYALTGKARDRFNQGTALHWDGRCEEAREAFEAYLRLDDDEPIEHAERQFEAKNALQQLNLSCPVPNAARAPAQTKPATPPSSVVAKKERSVQVSNPALSSPRPWVGESPAEATRAADVFRWSALGAGAALALAAVATGASSHAAASDVEDLGRMAARDKTNWDECCIERANRLDAKRLRYQTATRVLGVGSALLLGTATVLWVVDFDADGSTTGNALESAMLEYRSTF